jgi:hypothetical protein
MPESAVTATDFDPVVFNRNQALFPEDELAKYWGRHVAWSLDGTRIVADGATFEDVIRRLKDLAVEPGTTVSSFVHDPDVSYI